MAEVRTMAEGTLRHVQASGSGRTWATAAAAPAGLMGYVQSFSFNSAQTITTIMERGVPDHHKVTEKSPITVNIDFLWTGSALTYLTASGSTVPMVHLELRASAQEYGAGTAFYYQFMGAALESVKLDEAKEGDKVSMSFVTLAMTGPTASGYLS
jgi:hypothetical protein